MNSLSTSVIGILLLLVLIVVIELGGRIGRWLHGRLSDQQRNHVQTTAGAMLGLLALILGFSFSQALSRHDSRCNAVVSEANAIGTALLRIDLLDPAHQPQLRQATTDYIAHRIADARLSLDLVAQRAENAHKTGKLQQRIWDQLVAESRSGTHPEMSALTIAAFNDAFDARSAREAALQRHVAGLVLALLFATAIATSGVLGFSAGVFNHRASLIVHLMNGIITMLVLITLDLDRPRRGMIRIDPSPIEQLQAAPAP